MSQTKDIDQFQVHEMILRDRTRIAVFHDAIMNSKHLFVNKVVLDVGCGTGILSMFAAKAGAKRVYAVDACPKICRIAEQLIRCNRLATQIQIINSRIEDIDKFDEPIDIILSDWMGYYLFHESILESVIYARDNFLRISTDQDDLTPDQNESIFIFPSHAYLYCAPFVDQHLRIEMNTMWKDYFDLNMTPILAHIKNSNLAECVIDCLDASQLIQDAQLIQSINLRTVKKDDLRSMRSLCEFEIENACIISGFCFWFDCYFSSSNNSAILRSTRLSTSPFSPKTLWKQTLVFLPNDIYPLQGDIVPVNIKLKRSIDNRQQCQLTVALKKIKQSSHRTDDDINLNDLTLKKRQRRRSSTISYDKRLIYVTKSPRTSSESSATNSDEEKQLNEHSIPCSCDRDRCKLIRTIIENNNQENRVQ